MVPAGLGDRGAALWMSLGQSSADSPSGVLALEACRTADRLDKLNESLTDGAEWLRIAEDRDGEIVLYVDKPLTEARLQSAALKALLESPVLKVESGVADELDDFSARREARRAAAQSL